MGQPPANHRAISSAQLAARLNGTLIGGGDVSITHLDVLERAGPGAMTFIRSTAYATLWPASRASAALVGRDVPLSGPLAEPGEGRCFIVVPDADLALITTIEHFAPPAAPHAPGVHPSAVVAPDAVVHPAACVGPQCTIGAGARIDEGAVLVAQVYIGDGARVGRRTVLHPGVRIMERSEVGAECILHPGVVIGADGFGYRPGRDGLVKVPHIGNTVIHDRVEIGANACIDRAKFGSTIVGAGTKIDNFVQVAHNCRIGRSCLLCGHVGLAGSVTLGDGVVLGGKVGVADNVEIGAGAKIAAFAGVNNNVPPGAVWMGAPAGPAGEWRRTYARLRLMGKNRTER